MTTLRRQRIKSFVPILEKCFLGHSQAHYESAAALLADAAESNAERKREIAKQGGMQWAVASSIAVDDEISEAWKTADAATKEFEAALGFEVPLMWDKNAEWVKFREWVILRYKEDANIFSKYQTWRMDKNYGIGKVSNGVIRNSPLSFRDSFAMFAPSSPKSEIANQSQSQSDPDGTPVSY